jgi:hypothetical protein
MTTAHEALLQQALEALEVTTSNNHSFAEKVQLQADAITALRAALEQPEQEPHWLTKELMADYLDMIAEAISENSTEMLRHKAHWMRTRGEV